MPANEQSGLTLSIIGDQKRCPKYLEHPYASGITTVIMATIASITVLISFQSTSTDHPACCRNVIRTAKPSENPAQPQEHARESWMCSGTRIASSATKCNLRFDRTKAVINRTTFGCLSGDASVFHPSHRYDQKFASTGAVHLPGYAYMPGLNFDVLARPVVSTRKCRRVRRSCCRIVRPLQKGPNGQEPGTPGLVLATARMVVGSVRTGALWSPSQSHTRRQSPTRCL